MKSIYVAALLVMVVTFMAAFMHQQQMLKYSDEERRAARETAHYNRAVEAGREREDCPYWIFK